MALARDSDGSPVRLESQSSRLLITWHRFRQRPRGVAALLILALLVIGIIAVPILSPFQYSDIEIPTLWLAPVGTVNASGQVHLLGTDHMGRDVFTRLFFAGRVSLGIALAATLIVVAIGSIVGAVAGAFGGWIDSLLMRVTDFMLALPLLPMFVFVLRFVRTSTSPTGTLGTSLGDTFSPDAYTVDVLVTLTGIFVLFGWMGISRLVRGAVLSLRTLPYVEAAQALGATKARIIFKHLLPNASAPIIVAATFAVGDFLIWESVLSYLGQGIADVFVPTWGNLLANAQDYVWRLGNLNPFEDIRGYLIIFPIAILFITVLCLNYVGEALRDALDPHGIRLERSNS